MSSMISRSNELPSEVVDSLLVGLEDLVLAATDQQVRRSALGQLAIAGMHEHNDRFQIPNRLERIYHRSDDAFIRIQVVGLMSWQANQHAAAEVLREIVLEAPVVDESRPMVAEHPFRVPAIQAMHGLLRLGEPGRAVLRELHRSGQVRDPRVQRLLDERAREDFRDPG